MDEDIRRRRMPVVGGGAGRFSFIHVDDAAAATVVALDRGAPGDLQRHRRRARARARLGARAGADRSAPKPRRVPLWLGAAGRRAVALRRGQPARRVERQGAPRARLGAGASRTTAQASPRSSAARAREPPAPRARTRSPGCRLLGDGAVVALGVRRSGLGSGALAASAGAASASGSAAASAGAASASGALAASAGAASRPDALAASAGAAWARRSRLGGRRPRRPHAPRRRPRPRDSLSISPRQHGLRRAEHHRHVAPVVVRALLDAASSAAPRRGGRGSSRRARGA